MRGLIYDAAILPLTSKWYHEVLDRLDDGARVLDVGIGTGGALCRNASTVKSKGITVVGIDIDGDYIKRATKRIEKAGLADRVEARLQSVYEADGGPYDAVYFSASFMLLPDPQAALQHVMSLLKDEGQVFFTQTFQTRRSPLMEKAKPLLKKVTTIDFGTVTYEEDFRKVTAEAGLELTEFVQMGSHGARAYCLAAGAPA